MKQKSIVTIQDISCFGKCSLTVALPIISAMGIGCSIIPTAVLSTHTQFKNFTFCDLTDEIEKISSHWKEQNIEFDGIYTGYLGSQEQIDIMARFIDDFRKEGSIVLVDPAMADNGKLYPGFGDDFPRYMASLCAKADVIDPNLTEATLMLGEPFVGEGYDREYIYSLAKRLCTLGCKTAVVTGVKLEGKHGAVAYESETGKYSEYLAEDLPVSSHGTGDVFSAALMGAMILGKDMYESIKIAADFTVSSIRLTIGDTSHWYGVKFENAIPELVKAIEA